MVNIEGIADRMVCGDVPDRERVAGVLDNAVAGAADRAEAFCFWIGDEDLHGNGGAPRHDRGRHPVEEK